MFLLYTFNLLWMIYYPPNTWTGTANEAAEEHFYIRPSHAGRTLVRTRTGHVDVAGGNHTHSNTTDLLDGTSPLVGIQALNVIQIYLEGTWDNEVFTPLRGRPYSKNVWPGTNNGPNPQIIQLDTITPAITHRIFYRRFNMTQYICTPSMDLIACVDKKATAKAAYTQYTTQHYGFMVHGNIGGVQQVAVRNRLRDVYTVVAEELFERFWGHMITEMYHDLEPLSVQLQQLQQSLQNTTAQLTNAQEIATNRLQQVEQQLENVTAVSQDQVSDILDLKEELSVLLRITDALNTTAVTEQERATTAEDMNTILLNNVTTISAKHTQLKAELENVHLMHQAEINTLKANHTVEELSMLASLEDCNTRKTTAENTVTIVNNTVNELTMLLNEANAEHTETTEHLRQARSIIDILTENNCTNTTNISLCNITNGNNQPNTTTKHTPHTTQPTTSSTTHASTTHTVDTATTTSCLTVEALSLDHLQQCKEPLIGGVALCAAVHILVVLVIALWVHNRRRGRKSTNRQRQQTFGLTYRSA